MEKFIRLQEIRQVQLRRSQRKLTSCTPGHIKLLSDRNAHSNRFPNPSLSRRLYEFFYPSDGLWIHTDKYSSGDSFKLEEASNILY